ncbi:MAG: hypothetical protein ACI835_000827 [Planctomycetota bacterium]|jgi:hypothetical protein
MSSNHHWVAQVSSLCFRWSDLMHVCAAEWECVKATIVLRRNHGGE